MFMADRYQNPMSGAGKNVKPAEPKMDRMFPNVVAPPIHPMMLEVKGFAGNNNEFGYRNCLTKGSRVRPTWQR